MRTYKIHLLRHGETVGNEKGQYIGVTNSKLTTNGIKELERLVSKNIYPAVNTVFCAPHERAKNSAKIIFPDAEAVEIAEFGEMNFGEYEGKTMQELSDSPEYTDWVLGKTDRPKGGESFKEFAERLCIGLRKTVQYMMDNEIFEAAAVVPGGAIMTLLSVTALPRATSLRDYSAEYGKGYTVMVTPSLYAQSGIIEVISGIDE